MNSISILKNGNLVLTSQMTFAGEELTVRNHYRPYLVGHLPNNFGCIEYGTKHYDNDDKLLNGSDLAEGISEWINHKGLTYIKRD